MRVGARENLDVGVLVDSAGARADVKVTLFDGWGFAVAVDPGVGTHFDREGLDFRVGIILDLAFQKGHRLFFSPAYDPLLELDGGLTVRHLMTFDLGIDFLVAGPFRIVPFATFDIEPGKHSKSFGWRAGAAFKWVL